jgi:hypothetical protein
MTTSDRLREQIDCCRLGSSDLALPGMAELAAAVQRDRAIAGELAASQEFDTRLREALLDVPLPAGLADRLLAVTTSQVSGDVAGVVEAKTAAPTWRLNHVLTRRQWLLAGSSLAAALLLAVTAFKFARRSPPAVTRQELADAAAGWMQQIQASGSDWRPATVALPKGVASDSAVARQVQRWQSIPSPRGWSASVTAMELSLPNQPRAILFAVRSSARFSVPAIPSPTIRLPMSGVFQATAWQRSSSALVYVLVVEQRVQRIEEFLRPNPAA